MVVFWDFTAGSTGQWRTQEFCSWGVQQIQLRREGRENGDLGAVGVPLNLQMSETRLRIRLLRMYFPRNWAFGSALSKLWNFRGGGGRVEPPPKPPPRYATGIGWHRRLGGVCCRHYYDKICPDKRRREYEGSIVLRKVIKTQTIAIWHNPLLKTVTL
jgi:hypothetical protein